MKKNKWDGVYNLGFLMNGVIMGHLINLAQIGFFIILFIGTILMMIAYRLKK